MSGEKTLQEFNQKKTQYLLTSITLDVLGMVTYLIPFLGETGDMIFAPLYGLAIFIMYRKSIFSATIGGFTGTIEELLPGTDVIPTATIMWIYTYVMRKDRTLKNFVKEKKKEIEAMDDFNPHQINWEKLFELQGNEKCEAYIEDLTAKYDAIW